MALPHPSKHFTRNITGTTRSTTTHLNSSLHLCIDSMHMPSFCILGSNKIGDISQAMKRLYDSQSSADREKLERDCEADKERYYKAMEKYKPGWKRPSEKKGKGRKSRDDSDEDEMSDSDDDDSDGDSDSGTIRPSFVSDRPRRECTLGKNYAEDTQVRGYLTQTQQVCDTGICELLV